MDTYLAFLSAPAHNDLAFDSNRESNPGGRWWSQCLAENRKLIRNSPARKGPSAQAELIDLLPAGMVVAVLPQEIWSDGLFFKARLGDRSVFIRSTDAERTDDQVTRQHRGPVRDATVPVRESADVVWKRYADEVGGEYSTSGGRRFGPIEFTRATHTVNTAVGEWAFTLETYEVGGGMESAPTTWTRMSAAYTARHPLSFHVYRKTFFSDAGKRLLRRQDIEIGQADFDREFVIEASEKASVARLLASSSLRAILQIRDDLYLKTDGAALIFAVRGIISDIRLLRALHRLFVETLNELQRLGFIR